MSATVLLNTVVENTSGASRVFGFLGPHGMRLAANEVVVLAGDLIAQLGGIRSRRKFDKLAASLAAGDLALRSRPAPIVYDPTDEVALAIEVQAGELGTAIPDYTDAETESFSALT